MSIDAVAELTEALAAEAALVGADAGGDGRRLVELGTRLERIGSALRLAGTARVVETGSWSGEGDRGAGQWLARTTGTSMSEAIGTLKTAEQLAELPATAAALQRGELSPAQVREVAGAAAADPSAEQRLLAQATSASLGELRDEARRVRAAADPDPEATHRRIHAERHVRFQVDSDGAWRLTARGTADAGARIQEALRHRSDAHFREAHREGRQEPGEAYLFDALVDLVTAEPGAGSDARPLPKGAQAKLLVRVDWPALVRGRVLEGETCEIAGVGPVPVSVVREMSEDAFVAAILTNGTDICSVTHLGRKHTALQVSALQWRDPECARLGCNQTVRLEYEHRADWATTHKTEVEQSDRLCRTDHRLKTEHGWMLVEGSGKRPMVPPDHADHPLKVAIRRVQRARDG